MKLTKTKRRKKPEEEEDEQEVKGERRMGRKLKMRRKSKGDGLHKEEGEDEGCLPWVVALVAWMMLVESVVGAVGEEEAGGSDEGFG